jgi:hypothetical protein
VSFSAVPCRASASRYERSTVCSSRQPPAAARSFSGCPFRSVAHFLRKGCRSPPGCSFSPAARCALLSQPSSKRRLHGSDGQRGRRTTSASGPARESARRASLRSGLTDSATSSSFRYSSCRMTGRFRVLLTRKPHTCHQVLAQQPLRNPTTRSSFFSSSRCVRSFYPQCLEALQQQADGQVALFDGQLVAINDHTPSVRAPKLIHLHGAAYTEAC